MKNRNRTPPWLVALRKLPRDYYLRICIEAAGPDEEDKEEQLVAYLFQAAPEDGWPSRGAAFGRPDSPTEQGSAHPFEHEDCVVWGLNYVLSASSAFERALNRAMSDSVGRMKATGRP